MQHQDLESTDVLGVAVNMYVNITFQNVVVSFNIRLGNYFGKMHFV